MGTNQSTETTNRGNTQAKRPITQSKAVAQLAAQAKANTNLTIDHLQAWPDSYFTVDKITYCPVDNNPLQSPTLKAKHRTLLFFHSPPPYHHQLHLLLHREGLDPTPVFLQSGQNGIVLKFNGETAPWHCDVETGKVVYGSLDQKGPVDSAAHAHRKLKAAVKQLRELRYRIPVREAVKYFAAFGDYDVLLRNCQHFVADFVFFALAMATRTDAEAAPMQCDSCERRRCTSNHPADCQAYAAATNPGSFSNRNLCCACICEKTDHGVTYGLFVCTACDAIVRERPSEAGRLSSIQSWMSSFQSNACSDNNNNHYSSGRSPSVSGPANQPRESPVRGVSGQGPAFEASVITHSGGPNVGWEAAQDASLTLLKKFANHKITLERVICSPLDKLSQVGGAIAGLHPDIAWHWGMEVAILLPNGRKHKIRLESERNGVQAYEMIPYSTEGPVFPLLTQLPFVAPEELIEAAEGRTIDVSRLLPIVEAWDEYNLGFNNCQDFTQTVLKEFAA